MRAKRAYSLFFRAMLVWLSEQVQDDPGLSKMVRGAAILSQNGWEYAVFPLPGRRRRRTCYLLFAQNMKRPYDSETKVFALDFSIGSKLDYNSLKVEGSQKFPTCVCGKFDQGKGDIFFVQKKWGKEGEWDRLNSPQIRTRLFGFSLDALRFARKALNDEVVS